MKRRGTVRLTWLIAVAAALGSLFFAVPPAGAVTSSLSSGHTLYAGQHLWSSSGNFRLDMQTDGNLVVYSVSPSGASSAKWATNTFGSNNRTQVQTDGNVVVYNNTNTALWQSATRTSSTITLTMQSDGNLVIYQGNTPLWAKSSSRSASFVSNTFWSGGSIYSPTGGYRLTMQTDGNFVEYAPNGAAVWATYTSGAGNYARVQTDGNVVVYSSSGTPLWRTGTGGSTVASTLNLQSDGNIVLYQPGGAFWDRLGYTRDAHPMWSLTPAPFECTANNNGCDAPSGFNPNASYWGQDPNTLGNCTNYAAYRLAINRATRLSGTGDALTWKQRVQIQFGAGAVNNTPTVGSIAWWGISKGSSGHVAYVDQVSGNTVYISESIWNVGSGRHVLTSGTKGYPEAFLHLKDQP